MNNETKQRKKFITFGGPTSNFHYAVNRIFNEAQNIDFFDEFKCFTETNLKNDKMFWNKHGNFIENNKRGYGYWIWKSYLIKKSLETINDNDILIYCDAGCQINKNGIARLHEYVDMLNSNAENYGILSFQLQYEELLYTKNSIFEHFHSAAKLPPSFSDETSFVSFSGESSNSYAHSSLRNSPVSMENHPIPERRISTGIDEIKEKRMLQCMATIVIMKKNAHCENIINEWYNACENYNLINDLVHNEDPQFIENRHDQSILSVLVNKHGSVKLLDETYFYPNWDTNGINYPFWARRLK